MDVLCPQNDVPDLSGLRAALDSPDTLVGFLSLGGRGGRVGIARVLPSGLALVTCGSRSAIFHFTDSQVRALVTNGKLRKKGMAPFPALKEK